MGLSKNEKRRIEVEFLRQVYQNREAKPGCHEFALILDHLKPTFNMGKIFRSAQVFGAAEVHVIGTRHFDPGPGKGALKYVPARFHSEGEPCFSGLIERGYTIFAFEMSGAEVLGQVELPQRSAFLFGNEGLGIRSELEGMPCRRLRIPQYGVMESLNVSIAASIAMFEYVRQHGGRGPAAEVARCS